MAKDESRKDANLVARARQGTRRARNYIAFDLWMTPAKSRRNRVLQYVLRIAVMTVGGARRNEHFTLSAALTFRVLFAIIPLLAVMLALFKAFGGMASAAGEVKRLMLGYIAPDLGEQVMTHIDDFVGNINAAAIGVVGFAGLVYTVLPLMTTMEAALNRTWGVRKQRTLVRRFTVYWTILTLGPLVLALSIAMTTFVQSQPLYHRLSEIIPGFGRFMLIASPIVFGWILFTVLYMVMPNTKVKFGAALAGGIAAGTMWEVMKSFYVWYNTSIVVSYQFYGSLAALPVFLLWVYLSWVVFLFGSQVSFAMQNMKRFGDEVAASFAPPPPQRVALLLASDAFSRFATGAEPRIPEAAAAEFGIPPAAALKIAAVLVEAGILREASGGGLVPGRDPAGITMRDVLDAAGKIGPQQPPREPAQGDAQGESGPPKRHTGDR